MPYSATVFSVFIASPSDVIKERELVRQIINDWNVINARHHGVILQPIGWESDTYPALGLGPQEQINKQLLTAADLLIGIFWTRIGTPTKDYESGSVEEIKRHFEAHKPVMLYFSNRPVTPDSIDQYQYKKLQEFRKWCNENGLVETFTTESEFTQKFNRQLSLRVNSDTFFSSHLDQSLPDDEDPLQSTEHSIYQRLNDNAKMLLKEAAQDPNGSILKIYSLGGLTVQTNHKNFGSEKQDPKIEAEIEEALSDLEIEGLIQATNLKHEVFRVTAQGYRVAEHISQSPT